MRRDYLFWGTVLILLGGLLFINAAGIPLPGGVHPMQLFWPSIMVLLGVWILLGYFLRGGRKPGFVTTAKMINFFKRENAKYDGVDWGKDGLA